MGALRDWRSACTGQVRIGLGLDGSEIEIVGALLENGEWLAYHAMTPLTKEMMHEIACAQRRL